jgi:hypothetical protein
LSRLNVTRNNVQTFRNIDNVIALHKCKLCDFGERIYPIELEIKDTTDTDKSTSYLVLHLNIYSVGRLRTKLYEKRDDFNFPIVNFPSICSNISATPAYEESLHLCSAMTLSILRNVWTLFLVTFNDCLCVILLFSSSSFFYYC